MNRGVVSVSVKIPEGTERAFSKLVEAWNEGVSRSVRLQAESVAAPSGFDELLPHAVEFWRSLSANERAIFGLWVDVAPELVSADEMVSRLGLTSNNSIRGHIRRLAGKASSAGFQAGWQSHKRDALTGSPLYGLRDFGTGEFDYDRLNLSATEYARLLSQARSIVNDEN